MRRFFTRARWDQERADEIETHLAHHIDDLIGRGVPPEAARQQALREFGNRTLVREEIYEQNSLPVIETLTRDLRYAVRVLAKAPGFTATAILTLGLSLLGHKDHALYDGSWSEWGSDPSLPLETGPAG